MAGTIPLLWSPASEDRLTRLATGADLVVPASFFFSELSGGNMHASTPAKTRRPSWPDPWRCTVEVLVVSGCPGTELTVARIREATVALGIEINLRFVIVDGVEQAQTLGFRGSPTVRVEGRDVDPDAEERPIGVGRRLYRAGETTEQSPPRAWIEAALAHAAPLLGPVQP
jgi:hypothetical protein